MSPKPHSQTVRGTLSNPKTQAAMHSPTPTPQLGDATSLKPEASNKPLPSNDSAPPLGEGNDADSSPSKKKESMDELPHSKKVRGTLANDDGAKVNGTQLGDPVSLKSETSGREMGRGVEREGVEKGGKSKL
ncbi:hypothetical protein CC86DRAFT_392799 [Ophiobolus disseminans]|uniref:Uncharacterized protein n=1 Tax=Ophiobolus disseminans TaxID=1469910 RepID=A0A6A7A6V5_9PLEO|nr:hypothetical protein CC86DRAFT_392799 [Ophiobolus disseminans]